MGGLGASWGVLGGYGAILEDFFGDIGAKLGATWAKLEPSWQQVAPKMGHVSAKMAMLGSFWEALAEFGKLFSEHFGRCIGYQKTFKNLRFLKVFGGFGVVGWVC